MTSFLERRILYFVRRQLGHGVAGRLGSSARLTDDLALDPLELVRLLTHLERRYGIRIGDGELPRLRTVADLAGCVRRHLAARPPCPARRPPGYDLVYHLTANHLS